MIKILYVPLFLLWLYASRLAQSVLVVVIIECALSHIQIHLETLKFAPGIIKEIIIVSIQKLKNIAMVVLLSEAMIVREITTRLDRGLIAKVCIRSIVKAIGVLLPSRA